MNIFTPEFDKYFAGEVIHDSRYPDKDDYCPTCGVIKPRHWKGCPEDKDKK